MSFKYTTMGMFIECCPGLNTFQQSALLEQHTCFLTFGSDRLDLSDCTKLRSFRGQAKMVRPDKENGVQSHPGSESAQSPESCCCCCYSVSQMYTARQVCKLVGRFVTSSIMLPRDVTESCRVLFVRASVVGGP